MPAGRGGYEPLTSTCRLAGSSTDGNSTSRCCSWSSVNKHGLGGFETLANKVVVAVLVLVLVMVLVVVLVVVLALVAAIGLV